ncbi:MAG: hypothetical protein EHM33_00895 [Chloroflexi bacterium]|nr:MAG: hypothetical protein EHM33_00895 [Chloroflexota bacterium]
MKLEVNQIVYYQNQPVRVVRGAPVRFGEKRVVIERRDRRRLAVKVSLLTKRAVDGATGCASCAHADECPGGFEDCRIFTPRN